MTRKLTSALPALALFACGEVAATDPQRQIAENVISQVVSNVYPALFVPPLANCMINNATNKEVLALARASDSGITSDTTATALAIGRRAATMKCFTDNGQNVSL